jgi:hypothetical protein
MRTAMKEKRLSRIPNPIVKVEIVDHLGQDEIDRREKTLAQLVILAAQKKLRKKQSVE